MLVLHLASTNLVSAKSVCKCGNGEVDSPSKKVSIVIEDTHEDIRIHAHRVKDSPSLVFGASLCPPTRCSLFQRARFTLLPIRGRPLLRDRTHKDYIGLTREERSREQTR